jgi:membrane fusion protein (multidrug efflux system)
MNDYVVGKLMIIKIKSKKSNINKKIIILILTPIAVLIYGLYFYFFNNAYISTDDAYIKIAKVSVSAEVQGKVKQINIKDNAQVKKGEVLFKIDDMPYKIVLVNAIANLEKAKDYINSMKALYEQNLAELNKIDENIAYSKTEYQRYMELEKKSATSERALNLAQHNLDATIKQRNIVLKQIEETKAKLDGDPSLPANQYSYYNEALSGLSKAQLNLEHTEIKAPFDGKVANFAMLPGEYINVGAPLFYIVDYKNTWIEANFKETDLQNVKINQAALIEVDTYPGKKFDAKVVSIAPASGSEFSLLPPENSSGNWVKVVQRIKVRLELTNKPEDIRLLSGMSAYVTIDTKSVEEK